MSNSEDQKRYEDKVAKLREKRLAQSNANGELKKQVVTESFVYKVLNGQEPMTRLTDYMDLWKPESQMQLHDFLGFDEREWLMIVADQRSYPFIIQERAFRLGKIEVNRFNYAKLIEVISQKDQSIEIIVKSAMDPTGTMQKLVAQGIMDRVPSHLMVAYQAYGFMQHKLFIDLVDIANVKFSWDKTIPQVSEPIADKEATVVIPPPSPEVVKEVNQAVEAEARLQFVASVVRESLKGFIGQPNDPEKVKAAVEAAGLATLNHLVITFTVEAPATTDEKKS